MHLLTLILSENVELVPYLQSIYNLNVLSRTFPYVFREFPLQTLSIYFPSPCLKLSFPHIFSHSFEINATFDDAIHVYSVKLHKIDRYGLVKSTHFPLEFIEFPLEVQIMLRLEF